MILPILRKLRQKETNIRSKKNQGKIELNFSDKELFKFLNSTGFPIGRKGQNITLPDIFYKKISSNMFYNASLLQMEA
jgi:hypothetical protein